MAYESCFPNFPSPAEITLISTSVYLMVSLYLSLLVMALHNTWFYLIKQKKYRIYLFFAFYALVYTLIISRIYYYVYQILYLHNVTNCQDIQAEEAKVISDYARIVLGLFQCAQIIELNKRLSTVRKAMASQNLGVEDSQLRKYLQVLYIVVNVVLVVVLAIGLMFAILLYQIFIHELSMDVFVSWYILVTGVIYLTLGSFFAVSLVRLYQNMASSEIKQIKFASARVKAVSTAFAIAYTIHTLVFSWAAFLLYLKGLGVLKDKSAGYITWSWILGQSFTIIWDIIPISILLIVQHMNLKKPEPQLEHVESFIDPSFSLPTGDEMFINTKRVSENSAYQEVPRDSILYEKAKLSASEIEQLFKPQGLTNQMINSSRNDNSDFEKNQCLFDGISNVSEDSKGHPTNIHII